MEDNTYVVKGPEPTYPELPKDCLGKLIINSVLNNPSDEVLVCAHTGQKISYKQIVQKACYLAESLRKYGCTEKSFIAISSENHLNYFIPLLAGFIVGSTVVPLNPTYTTEELEHVMHLTKPKIIFCSIITVHNILENIEEFKYVEKVVLMDPIPVPGVEIMDEFIKSQIGSRSVDPRNVNPFVGNPADHVALILTSSGTTGMPKGVMVTDQNIQLRVNQSNDPIYLGDINTKLPALGLLPMFHGFGIILAITGFTRLIKIIVMKSFDEDLFLKTIQDYKMEFLAVAPPLAVFLAKSPKVDKYDLSSLKFIGCGAAPLNKETEDILKKRLKNINQIRQGYGLTECLAATLGEAKNDKDGSIGRAVTFTTIKIRDPETGKSLGPRKVGEICIKSPLVMKGYYRNEKATKESFTPDGWLRTGDLGYYDEEEFFFIVDRLKELIKYKAFQVAPAELEAILLNHPKVMDAGVVGKPDEMAGELPVAFVVKKPGFEVTEKEIQDFVASKVSPQKKLRGGVIFIHEIPKSVAGKILRKELKHILITEILKKKSKL